MLRKGRLGPGMTMGSTALMATTVIVAGCLILVNGSVQADLAIAASSDHARDIGFLLALPPVLAVIFAFVSKADRKCADDYAYQLIAAAAMVGMFTMMIASVAWSLDFVADGLGLRGLRGQDMMAIGLLGWGVAYFTFRIRGLK